MDKLLAWEITEHTINKKHTATDPPMGNGDGAEHEALPTFGALTGLPLMETPLVLGQVRAL